MKKQIALLVHDEDYAELERLRSEAGLMSVEALLDVALGVYRELHGMLADGTKNLCLLDREQQTFTELNITSLQNTRKNAL